jgi:hypothetical protein
MNHLQDSKMEGPYGKLRNTFQKNKRYFIWWKNICEKGGGGLHFSNVVKFCFKTCHPNAQ